MARCRPRSRCSGSTPRATRRSICASRRRKTGCTRRPRCAKGRTAWCATLLRATRPAAGARPFTGRAGVGRSARPQDQPRARSRPLRGRHGARRLPTAPPARPSTAPPGCGRCCRADVAPLAEEVAFSLRADLDKNRRVTVERLDLRAPAATLSATGQANLSTEAMAFQAQPGTARSRAVPTLGAGGGALALGQRERPDRRHLRRAVDRPPREPGGARHRHAAGGCAARPGAAPRAPCRAARTALRRRAGGRPRPACRRAAAWRRRRSRSTRGSRYRTSRCSAPAPKARWKPISTPRGRGATPTSP